MAPPESDPRLTRRQRELLRDLEVAGRLKDIRDSENLKDQLAPKWYETTVGIFQFAAALGLLAAMVQHPALRADSLTRIVVFFFVLMVLSLVLGFEFMIFKLYHLRRANSIAQRRINQLEARVRQLEQPISPPADDPPSPPRAGGS